MVYPPLNVMLQTGGVEARPLAIGTARSRLWHRLARNVLLATSDTTTNLLAWAIAYVVWAAPMRQQSAVLYLDLAPLVLLFVVGYARLGLYPGLGLGPVEMLRRISYVTTSGYLVLAAFSFALKAPHVYSRATFLISFLLSLALVPLGRVVLFHTARRWHWWAEPVVVVGAGARAVRAIRGILAAGHLGYRPVAVLAESTEAVGEELEGVPIVGGLEQVPSLAAAGLRVAFVETNPARARALIDQLQQDFRRVIVLQEFEDLPVEGLQVRNLGDLVGIEYTNNLLRPGNQTAKRVLDIVLGIVAFALLLPVIAIAALLVLLIDGPPMFFYQGRAGLGGRRISVPKIRTMRRDADGRLEEYLSAHPALRDQWEARYKLRDDPRLIPGIGRLFRRFSIDELPQLCSVVIGDMSMVGPRPFPDYHLQKFTPVFQELRQRVRPGISGIWQITVRSEGGIEEQEAYDTYYIRNWSVWLDLYVLARTIAAVASGRGAY